MIRVAIIGGGVGGMSAAHELIARTGKGVDYSIDVYERQPAIPGGKARSLPVPNSGVSGRGDLPAEHGFRFFPGFYRHLPETMKGIPVADGTAFDNMVPTSEIMIASFNQAPYIGLSRFPTSAIDLLRLLREIFDEKELGLSDDDIKHFADRLWQIATSCNNRRLAEYEKICWWDFIDASSRSVAYQEFLAKGLSRSLTANDPHRGSTMTLGEIYLQLLYGMVEPGQPMDRVLNGPTNAVWIDPWRQHLTASGVNYHLGYEATSIQCANGLITGVTFDTASGPKQITADHFIFAVPVEVMGRLIKASIPVSPQGAVGDDNGPILDADPSLEGILELVEDVDWMNGILFYLNEDLRLDNGHQLYVSSPWALTGISQLQFWKNFDISKFGDGKVRGILSVDISDWHEPGIVYGKPAVDCTRDEVKAEVWAQLKKSLQVGGKSLLTDDMLVSWFIDPDISERRKRIENGEILKDAEPLLVHYVDSWHLRPLAYTRIPNLFLASDYVQTYTGLACMEGANEAARRAVNALLYATGSRASLCDLWPLHEPLLLKPFRMHDQRRFNQGLPWDGKLFG